MPGSLPVGGRVNQQKQIADRRNIPEYAPGKLTLAGEVLPPPVICS
jgi:hypothetical protein